MYYVTINGEKITGPMSLKDIIEKFGTVLSLEVSGFRLVKVG
jgi:hypothetical protein